jgi:type IV pilus assembly protein PilY1
MNVKWKECIASTLAISMLAANLSASAAPLALAQSPLVMPPGGTPEILFAIDNSESMDGNLGGAIMTGSGSLSAALGSLANSSSPTNYAIPTGFNPPLNAGTAGSAPYTVSCGSNLLCDNSPSRLNVAKQAIQTVINNNINTSQFGLVTYAVSGAKYSTWVYYMSPAGGPFTFSMTPPASGEYVANPCYNYSTASSTIKSNCTAMATLYGASTLGNSPYMSVGASSDDPTINDIFYDPGPKTGVFVNYTGPNPAGPYPPNFSLSQYNSGQVSIGYNNSQPSNLQLGTGPTNAGYVPYSQQVMYAQRGFAYYGKASSTGGTVVVPMTQTGGNFANALAPETNNAGTSEIKASAVQSPIAGLLAQAKTYLQSLPAGTSACPPPKFVALLTDGLPTQDLKGNAWPPLGSAAAAGYKVTATFNTDGTLNTTNNQALSDTITTLKQLAAAGINTYIVGLGAGVNASVNPWAAKTLQAMALAGNTNAYFSASNASALAKALQSIVNLAQQSASSVGVNAQKPQQPVQSYTQAYLALFQPDNWWGELKASPFDIATDNTVSLSAIANWDSSCALTGGTCPATASAVVATAQPPSAIAFGGRQVLTWNGAGVPFEWPNLSNAQLCGLAGQSTSCTLTTALTTKGTNVLNFLRGDRSNETANGGTLRTRTSVLGDIVNSSPVWVGAPAYSFPSNTWKDQLYGSAAMPENATGVQSYASYEATNATRLNVVYVGANDGFLHGFEAGSFDSTGTYQTATNDGREVLAYLPSPVFGLIGKSGGYTSPNYVHQFYVDATPGSGDLFFGGAWHTWLVGGLGAGGNAVYALDISNPAKFAESNASSVVVNEVSTSNIVCSNVLNCFNDLGNTYGTPIIRRMHNGDWAVIWGNGYNSTNGTAAIFIADISNSTGAWTIYELNTGYGASKDPTGKSRPDGIAQVGSADLDGDHVVDYLYAGDLFGNIWRFDVTSSSVSSWSVSKYGGTGPTPLYSVVDASGNAQPITTGTTAISVPAASGAPRVLLAFGTGKLLEVPDQTATNTQTMYGIWDYNMTNWDTLSSAQFAKLAAPQTLSRSKLQQQTVTGTYDSSGNPYSGTGQAYRTLSQNSVCWQGTSSCIAPALNNQYGWYLDFPSTGEELIYDATLISGVLTFNTFVPFSVKACATVNSGFTMGINAGTGGALANSFFANSQGNFVTINGQVVAGIGQSAVGTPTVVTINGLPYMVTQTSTGYGAVAPINLPSGGVGGRATWVQLR